MKAIVIGAGVIGINTAWQLKQRGWQVQVVERHLEAAQETSFANAGQISPSYSAPWANRQAPWLALRWMFDTQAPLLLRPQWDWRQWRWCFQFLTQCSNAAFERNYRHIFALGKFSHQALHEVLAEVPMQYQSLRKGIVHFYTDLQSFEGAQKSQGFYRELGVDRKFVSAQELLEIEPALSSYAHRIVGGSYSASDETGNAKLFTQQLAQACEQSGVEFLWAHQVQKLDVEGSCVQGIWVNTASKPHVDQYLHADAVVLACGVHTPQILRSVGLDAPIYPGLGYSASFPITNPEKAPWASVVEDKRLALSRLGNRLRVAGTVALAGYDRSLATPVAQARCQALAERIEAIFPGTCDTRRADQGGDPQYWAGLRPATPDSVPLIGPSKLQGLWLNAGHGTLGWTQAAGSAKALAMLMSGQKPEIAFPFISI